MDHNVDLLGLREVRETAGFPVTHVISTKSEGIHMINLTCNVAPLTLAAARTRAFLHILVVLP